MLTVIKTAVQHLLETLSGSWDKTAFPPRQQNHSTRASTSKADVASLCKMRDAKI